MKKITLLTTVLIYATSTTFSAMEKEIKQLNNALKNHIVAEVKELIQKNKKLLERKSAHKGTPIQLVIRKIHKSKTHKEYADYIEIGKFLIKESSLEIINNQDDIGATALIDAAQFTRNLPTLNPLINALLDRKGININAHTIKDTISLPKGSTALTITINNSNATLAAQLINAGADINKSETGNLSPLILAAVTGQLKTVELLLEKGAQTNIKLTNEIIFNLKYPQELKLTCGMTALSATQFMQKLYNKESQEYALYEKIIKLLKKTPQKTNEPLSLIKNIKNLEQSLSTLQTKLKGY